MNLFKLYRGNLEKRESNKNLYSIDDILAFSPDQLDELIFQIVYNKGNRKSL